MFEKLLATLPFNPASIKQLSFYAKRMRQEEAIRRVGLVFIVLAFLIQFFAFVSPPVATLAASPNDLIDGGFSSAAEAASDCQNNVENYGTILANYGITCSDVANASTLSINSDGWNKQLWSMGRDPYNIPGDTPVSISGLSYPVYERYLWGWDSPGTSSTYQVLNVTVPGGQTFFLMYGCGNLASVGFPQPVQKPPVLTITKTTVAGYPVANSTVAPGQQLGFQINLNNTGGPATGLAIADPVPANMTYVTQEYIAGTTETFQNNNPKWQFNTTMPAGATNWYADVYDKVNANTPNGTQICNIGYVITSQTFIQETNKICFTVAVPKKPTPPPPPKPTPPAPKPKPKPIPKPKPKPKPTPTCTLQLSSENTSACITISKAAANITENIPNANGTTAKAGDLIRYTLSATNKGSSVDKAYVFNDNLSYVLDYSTIVQANAGKVDSSNDISWKAVAIDPNKTATKQFEVRVDNPIPETPTSTSDPNYFNLKMTNTYGNTITISLPSTPVATLQTTTTQTTTLVNTGPGESIMIGAAIVAVAGFFFYRSRLIAKEARIAIREHSGGM